LVLLLVLLLLLLWDLHERHDSRRDVDDGGGGRVRASDGEVRAGWTLRVPRRRGCLLHRVANGMVPKEGRDLGRGEGLSGRSGGEVDPYTRAVEIDPLLALLIIVRVRVRVRVRVGVRVRVRV